MNENVTVQDAKQIADIKNKLWASFNILRGKMEIEEYAVCLYLLSLFNEGGDLRIATAPSDHEIFDQLNYGVSSVKMEPTTERLNRLYAFHEHFQPTLELLPRKAFVELRGVYQSLNPEILKKYFAEIFDYLLYEIFNFQGKMGGASLQPIELTELVCEIANLPEYSQVYNPFAGVASFGVMFPKTIAYLAQEINYATWVIGSLRLLAYKVELTSHFVNESSFQARGIISEGLSRRSSFNKSNFQHDLIVANPPMAMRLNEIFDGRFGPIRTAEHFLIENGVEDLNAGGKLIAILGSSFAFRTGPEHDLRKHLVDQDLVDMVIALPSGLQAQSLAATFILVINKNKKDNGFVRFVNGREFFTGTQNNRKKLDLLKLIPVINTSTTGQFVRRVSIESIALMDYNLDTDRYFIKSMEGYALRELMTPLRGQRNTEAEGRIIRIKDLKNDQFNYKLEPDASSDLETLSGELKIAESCLLIASTGNKLKPTFFHYIGTPIYVNSNLYSFKVDESQVDIDYLIAELYSDQAFEQIKSYQFGTGIPRIRKEDFLSIKIPVPGPLEQKAKVRGLREEYIRSKEKELQLEREILGLKDDAFREFAAINHTLRQYLNALKSNVSGTRKFIAKNNNNLIDLETVYSENLNQTFGEHLASLENTIDSMSALLHVPDVKEATKGEAYEMEMDLKKLIEHAQNRFKNSDIFQFEKLYVDEESFTYPDGVSISATINILADDFYRIFSNVISNAVEHGFKNLLGNNIIRTSLAFDDETNMLIVEISNNGRPIPDEFSIKHVTTRGEKTSDSKGSGIGGADIKSLMDKYDGEFDIKKDESAEFPVTYVLKFHLAVFIL